MGVGVKLLKGLVSSSSSSSFSSSLTGCHRMSSLLQQALSPLPSSSLQTRKQWSQLTVDGKLWKCALKQIFVLLSWLFQVFATAVEHWPRQPMATWHFITPSSSAQQPMWDYSSLKAHSPCLLPPRHTHPVPRKAPGVPKTFDAFKQTHP